MSYLLNLLNFPVTEKETRLYVDNFDFECCKLQGMDSDLSLRLVLVPPFIETHARGNQAPVCKVIAKTISSHFLLVPNVDSLRTTLMRYCLKSFANICVEIKYDLAWCLRTFMQVRKYKPHWIRRVFEWYGQCFWLNNINVIVCENRVEVFLY